MKTIYSVFAAVLLLAACKNEPTETAQTQQQQQPEAPKVTLTDATPSTAFDDATLKSFTYKDGKFTYAYSGTGYELGKQTPDATDKVCANSAEGQHIHFIVNDEPYKAFYTADFENKMEDGTYSVLSFLSRSYHESIKNGKAYLAQNLTFKGGKLTETKPIENEMLFYSRPKGTYTGKDTKELLLDFFLVNTTLSPEGNKVKVTVNGELIATVTEWKPYMLQGLPMGKNTVMLELVNAAGERVNTPLNPVTREFELMADPI